MRDDTKCTSSALLTLPPEIRERVYELYFNETAQAETNTRPVEPPLLYVSKRLRAETLPIFYSNFTLQIRTFVKCDFYGNVWLTTKKWYSALDPIRLRHVEHFRLRFNLIQQYTGELVPVDFNVSLRKRTQSYSISHAFDRAWFQNPYRTGDPADFEDILAALKEHLHGTLADLIRDPGIGNFRAIDVDSLVKVDPDSLPLQTVG